MAARSSRSHPPDRTTRNARSGFLVFLPTGVSHLSSHATAWQSRGASYRADRGNAVPRGLRDFNGTLPLDAPLAPPPAIGAEGHRNRMRLRLITAGPEAIADHELLEMVLFLAL